jgi:hypothetical protein
MVCGRSFENVIQGEDGGAPKEFIARMFWESQVVIIKSA